MESGPEGTDSAGGPSPASPSSMTQPTQPGPQNPARSSGRGFWWALAAIVVVLSLLLWWWGVRGGGTGPGSDTGARDTSAAPSPEAPQSIGEPSEGELGSGWDRPPDTPVADPASLDADQRTALIRLGATAPGTDESCTADDVAAYLSGFDAALGHPFSHLMVTNTSERACTVQGYPGIGGYGRWGSTFLWTVEQRGRTGAETPAAGDQPVVTLQPGASASADLEWTGELAGAESEHLWAFAVQLTQGQAAGLFVPPGDDPRGAGGSSGGGSGSNSDEGGPSAEEVRQELEDLDIGMLTTVRVGAWGDAGK